MKKALIFVFSPILLIAGDLIVDKNALTQYQTDNYLRFDPFDFDNIFEEFGNFYGKALEIVVIE